MKGPTVFTPNLFPVIRWSTPAHRSPFILHQHPSTIEGLPHNCSQPLLSPYSCSASLISTSLVPKVLFNSLQPIKFWFSSSPVAFLIFHYHLSSPHARTNTIVPIYLFYHFTFHSCSSTHIFVYYFSINPSNHLWLSLDLVFQQDNYPKHTAMVPTRHPTPLVSSTSSPTH